MITIRTIAIAMAIAPAVAAAQPLPQPKVGQCPSGYRESGGYCAPTSDRAPNAVPNAGSAHQSSCNRATTASTRAGADRPTAAPLIRCAAYAASFSSLIPSRICFLTDGRLSS
jgi:hypothetical protein